MSGPHSVREWIALASQVAQMIAAGKRTIGEIRGVIVRESPESVEEFDALVASARKPWAEAADTAAGK